jgi:hypothetical protein
MPHITYTTRRNLGLCLVCLAPIPPGITRCLDCRQRLRAKRVAKQWGLSVEQALRLIRERDKTQAGRRELRV